MQQGIVKRVNSDRGFGFIRPEGKGDHGKDVFFHATSVKNRRFDEIQEGDRVEFDVESTDKGPRASNVNVL